MRTASPSSETAEGRALDVLIACSRARLDDEDLSHIEKLARREVDWPRVLELAGIHGTRPTLYRALATALRELVEPVTFARLRDDCIASAAHNLALTSELLGLLDALEREGVAALPMKGAVLAEVAYGNVGLREFQDIDILVRQRDVARASAVLLANGYIEIDTPRDSDAYSRVFTCAAAGAVVDLHWDFAGRRFCFGLEPSGLFDRCVSVEVGGRTIRSTSPEDTLLLLCMHGAKHCWSRLAWICDIAELVRVHQRIDWAALTARARESGNERMLLVGLLLASDFFGTRLPAHIGARASRPPVTRLALAVRAWLVGGKDAAADPIEREAFYMAMRERPMDRASHLAHGIARFLAPTAQDARYVRLPKALSWLHWIVRPVRIVFTYGNPGALLKRLIGIN
jgi:hypothetical protein